MMTRSRKVRSGTHTAVNGFSIMGTFYLIACLLTWSPPVPSSSPGETDCCSGLSTAAVVTACVCVGGGGVRRELCRAVLCYAVCSKAGAFGWWCPLYHAIWDLSRQQLLLADVNQWHTTVEPGD